MCNQLNSIQHEVLLGTMLGDACLTKTTKRCRSSKLSLLHGIKQLEWLNFKAEVFANFISRPASIRQIKDKRVRAGYTTNCSVYTRHHPIWTELERRWYLRDEQGNYIYNSLGHRIKMVPRDISLTWLAIAAWYLDDGHLAVTNNTYRHAILATNAFTEDDVNFLIGQLTSLKIECGIQAKMIKIYSRSIVKFTTHVTEAIQSIGDIPDCMRYKTDLALYRKPYLRFGEQRSQIGTTNAQAREVARLYNDTSLKLKEIAEQVGLSQNNVRHIVYGEAWQKIVGFDIVRRKLYENNTSGVRGVIYKNSGKPWIARGNINGKRIHLGTFETKTEAIDARKKWEASLKH